MARIVIIGGGIGGLSAAGCLRARGIEADVYERAPALREVGAALGLWPNATRVLKHLGVLDALLQRAHVPPTGALRDQHGRVLRRMTAMQTDVPTVFAHRADLHGALLTAIPPERVHLNHNCTGLQRNGPLVRAVFADGTWSPWVDGIIGADGVRSVFREMTLHDGLPIYRGYVAWRGVARFSSDDVVGETWGRGQRFGFIPLGGERVGWWATANRPGPPDAAGVVTGTQAHWKRQVINLFAGWHDPIPALLAATPEEAFLCNAIGDRPPARVWGEGPMTLLGDAAHPTTPNLGQGACMAIEDAAVLAHALAEIPEVTRAFRIYEATRFDRTALIVRESLKFGRIGQWHNVLVCALRNWLLHRTPEWRMQRQLRDLWLYDAWEAPLAGAARLSHGRISIASP